MIFKKKEKNMKQEGEANKKHKPKHVYGKGQDFSVWWKLLIETSSSFLRECSTNEEKKNWQAVSG